MDRGKQLSNVSFGGAWSEQIEDDEKLSLAFHRLERAVNESRYEDLRGFDDVSEALVLVTSCHPKGAMLAKAWSVALTNPNPGLRSQELQRIVLALQAGLGVRLRA